MHDEIEQVIRDLLPHLLSVGVEANLEEVSGGVACIRLARFAVDAEPDMERLRRALTRELQQRVSGLDEVVFVGELARVGERTGPLSAGELEDRIREVLDVEVNPAIASHGGVIDLVAVDGSVAVLQMGGGCQGCAASAITLRARVELLLLEAVPEITAVRDVTDHDAGDAPFYARGG